MKVLFWINGEKQAGKIGVVEGYVQEGINEVSLIELVLVSNGPIVDDECRQMVGANVTLIFADQISNEWQLSRFDGIAFEFHSLDTVTVGKDLFKYQMIVRPKIWLANYNVNAASFPNITKPDAVKMVLESWGMSADIDFEFTLALPDKFLEHKQILQNQASDLVFIQNLLKESGINYYFGTDEKDGKGNEKVKMTNFFNYKKQQWDDIIPYNPNASMSPGITSKGYRLTSFETHYRATTSAVTSIANLGDGLTTVRTTKLNVNNGKYGRFKHFTADGENVQGNLFLQKNDTISRSEFHEINQALFEGRSNYYLFRCGEVYKMDDAASACVRPVLISHCFHHFRQTVNSALTAKNDASVDDDVDYTNLFSGVDGDVDNKNALNFRPDQTWGKTTVELRRMFSAWHSVPRDEREAPRYDIDELEKYNLKKKVAELEADLSVAKELSGLMVGTVTKDAWVTKNTDTGAYYNELVCQVACERFPEEIIVKVALGWLTQHGWLSLLPRVGKQIYFQFVNGAGGQNEAVLVGYRPTGDTPIHDPAKTTTSTKLGAGDAPTLGEPAEKVVGKGEFAPENKYRQALLGEGAVAEVAVIDGGEDTVYLHANNRICVIGDKSVNVSTGSLCESAGSASQQFGSLDRGVTGNQKVGISEHLERWVGGTTVEETKSDVTSESTEGSIYIKSDKQNVDVFGCKKVMLHDDAESHVTIEGDMITSEEKGGNTIVINPDMILGSVGDAGFSVLKKEKQVSLASKSTMLKVLEKNIHLNPTETVVIDAGKSILGNGKEKVGLVGEKKTLIAGAKASIQLDSDGVVVTGTEIKLNC